jgi:hypothetical protein
MSPRRPIRPQMPGPGAARTPPAGLLPSHPPPGHPSHPGIPGGPQPFPVSTGIPVMGVTPPVSSILAGPSQMPAQRALNEQEHRREMWPYTHVFPPPQAIRQEPEGIIPSPFPGVTTVVLSYQVPDGFQFLLTGLFQVYSGASFVLGSTDITWLLDINTPVALPSGGTTQGYPVQQLSPSNLPKGGMLVNPACLFAPWPLPKPEPLNSLDTLRSKVTTTGAIPVGAPNFFITIFMGWMWESTR